MWNGVTTKQEKAKMPRWLLYSMLAITDRGVQSWVRSMYVWIVFAIGEINHIGLSVSRDYGLWFRCPCCMDFTLAGSLVLLIGLIVAGIAGPLGGNILLPPLCIAPLASLPHSCTFTHLHSTFQ